MEETSPPLSPAKSLGGSKCHPTSLSWDENCPTRFHNLFVLLWAPTRKHSSNFFSSYCCASFDSQIHLDLFLRPPPRDPFLYEVFRGGHISPPIERSFKTCRLSRRVLGLFPFPFAVWLSLPSSRLSLTRVASGEATETASAHCNSFQFLTDPLAFSLLLFQILRSNPP